MTRTTLGARAALVALVLATIAGACGSDSTGSAPLATPSGLTASQVSLTKIHLSWSLVSGATGYLLERTSAATPGVYTRLGGGVLVANQFDDTTASAGVSYGFRTAAVSASDTSAFSGVINFSTGVQQATISTNITTSRTLSSDTVYVLSGYIKVTNGATLTIQPGTKVVGDTNVVGSSLWILRGSKIDANGTAVQPIVFTSQRSPGNRKPGDWGGIIIIGNGIINRTGTTILTEGGAAGQAENYAGGVDNNDNSGVLRYVRIEFAGYDVSAGAGQELNSLSSYAVGRGTTYEYVQTMAGLDDSFEWWGGAVDGRYLVSYESGDDHFDWTEGYQGRNQFLIAFQSQRLVPRPGTGVFSSDPRGFEGDGCDPAVTGCTLTATGASTPYSMPVFANFTMIGPGQLAGIPADGNGGVWRRGTGGTFLNGVMARWKGIAINIRDAWTDSLFVASAGKDSLRITNVLLSQNGFNFDTTGAGFSQTANWDTARLNSIKQYAASVAADTLLGITLNPSALDWTPKGAAPVSSGAGSAPAGRVSAYFSGTWVNTSFLGAADPSGTKWWQGWTAYNIN